jgi:hypothetical protein
MQAFLQHGPTPDNRRKYQQIYNTFIELAGSHTSKVARGKFGYKRSPELTQKGAMLLLHKDILDCKHRNSPVTPSIQRHAALLNVDPNAVLAHETQQIRRMVTTQRQELWSSQKGCKELRIEWLKRLHKIAREQRTIQTGRLR